MIKGFDEAGPYGENNGPVGDWVDRREYDEGYKTSSSVPDCAEQLTTKETIDAGGPDEWGRTAMYHKGWDAAILDARARRRT